MGDATTAGGERPPLTAAVQAGGESRRMGRSKATVPFGGRPLLCRVAGRVAPVADEIVVTTNEPENLGFLFEEPWGGKVRLVRDVFETRGSLAGLYTALSAASHDWVAVCACDMMDVSAELFAAELEVAVAEGRDVVIPVNENGHEPFHAVYRRLPCLEAAGRALAAEGKKSMKSAIFGQGLDVRELTMDEVCAVVPGGGCFENCNTPEELARAERRVFGQAAPRP